MFKIRLPDRRRLYAGAGLRLQHHQLDDNVPVETAKPVPCRAQAGGRRGQHSGTSARA